jgi:hypothetical protein
MEQQMGELRALLREKTEDYTASRVAEDWLGRTVFVLEKARNQTQELSAMATRLQPVATGPWEVIADRGEAVLLQMNGEGKTVSKSRCWLFQARSEP